MTVVLPSDVPRRSALVTLYESGKVNSSHSQDELTGPHRAAIWSIARDETIQAWWEDGGELNPSSLKLSTPAAFISLMASYKFDGSRDARKRPVSDVCPRSKRVCQQVSRV